MLRRIATAALLSAPAAAPAAEAFVGVATHNIDFGFSGCCAERAADVEFGLRSAPWARVLTAELRGHVLGSVNTRGGLDFAAAGVSLRFALPLTGVYLAPGIGAAVQDGSAAHIPVRADRLYLGSQVLFEPELSIGARLVGPFAVEASYVHLSHAHLAGSLNPGFNALAVRGVVRF